MKKIIISVLIIIFLGTGIYFLIPKTKTFELETKYYNNPKQQEITRKTLNKLIKEKESFLLFVYQPMCVNSTKFSELLEEFQKQEEVFIYKIPFSKLKDTILEEKIKYYPSFVLFKEGKVVDYLDSNEDADTAKFKKLDTFNDWYSKNIAKVEVSRIEEDNTNNEIIEQSVQQNKMNALKKDINLDEVKKEDGKINIYFFWGNGCPHCEDEFAFFDSLEEEIKNKFNLYTFETWYNKDNEELAQIFAKELNIKLEGVPFTVIGNKGISGFGKTTNEIILEAIEEAEKTKTDIYFDKIKNN